MTQRVIYIFFIINLKASNIIITAQVSDMAHGSLVILKILGITKSNTESKLKHHINAGFLKNSFSARNNIGKVSFQYYLYFSC